MSGQKEVSKNRVNITHTVQETSGQREVEIPWTMAVLMDGSGNHPEEKKNSLDETEFETVKASTFDDYLKAASPRLSVTVPSYLSGNKVDGELQPDENEQLVADITIEHLDDFTPDAIAQKVPGVKEVYETRKKLEHLLRTLNNSRSARKMLSDALTLKDKNDENSMELAGVLAQLSQQSEQAAGSEDAGDEK
jgi:type VI secretion system protein ImpB